MRTAIRIYFPQIIPKKSIINKNKYAWQIKFKSVLYRYNLERNRTQIIQRAKTRRVDISFFAEETTLRYAFRRAKHDSVRVPPPISTLRYTLSGYSGCEIGKGQHNLTQVFKSSTKKICKICVPLSNRCIDTLF